MSKTSAVLLFLLVTVLFQTYRLDVIASEVKALRKLVDALPKPGPMAAPPVAYGQGTRMEARAITCGVMRSDGSWDETGCQGPGLGMTIPSSAGPAVFQSKTGELVPISRCLGYPFHPECTPGLIRAARLEERQRRKANDSKP